MCRGETSILSLGGVRGACPATLDFALRKFYLSVADPGENLTGALHSNFGRGGRGGRGLHGSWIYAMMLLSKTQ